MTAAVGDLTLSDFLYPLAVLVVVGAWIAVAAGRKP